VWRWHVDQLLDRQHHMDAPPDVSVEIPAAVQEQQPIPDPEPVACTPSATALIHPKTPTVAPTSTTAIGEPEQRRYPQRIRKSTNFYGFDS
ncbi:MAG TPA: hypothetical protein VHT72_06905, partial [Puia sp.]|nr:hypothetical protein [Puia sp.]